MIMIGPFDTIGIDVRNINGSISSVLKYFVLFFFQNERLSVIAR